MVRQCGTSGKQVGSDGRSEAIGTTLGGRIGSGSGRWVGGGSGCGSRRGSRRGSPYNHPPSRWASTRCGGERNRAEENWAKSQGMDAAWGSRVLSVELRYLFQGVVEVLWVFPGVSLCSIAFPFDQVLKFPSEHSTVQDLFHDVFLFSINEFQRRQRVPMSSGDQIVGSGRQIRNVENWVKTSHRGRQDQAVSVFSDASFDWVGA